MNGYSYRKDYMRTHDIDWFFRHGGIAYHVASNGGIIPKEIISKENAAVQESVYKTPIPDDVEIDINEKYIKENVLNGQNNNLNVSAEKQYNDYIKSFVSMAKIGFVSLDRKDSNEYFWVAKPKYMDKVNLEKFGLIPEFKYIPVIIYD